MKHTQFDLPPGMRGEVVESSPIELLANVEGAIAETLAQPVGAPTPVVRPGGFLIVPARCQEGAGEGAGGSGASCPMTTTRACKMTPAATMEEVWSWRRESLEVNWTC